MGFNEQWVPVIAESVKWVKDKLGPSKKELQIKVTDLESQVKALSFGNATLSKSMEQIITEVLNQLVNGGYRIVDNTIVFVKDNHGQINVRFNSEQNNETKIRSIFDDIDKEIAQSRLLRSSERGDISDNI